MFGYDDEQMYPLKGFVSVKSEFATREEAESVLFELERKEFQGKQLAEWQGVSPCGVYDAQRMQELNDYLKQEFDKGILIHVDWSEDKMPNREYHLPKSLTIEQTKEIRRISTVKHFAVIEVNDTKTGFYGLNILGNYGLPTGWVKREAEKYSDGKHETAQVPMIFESEQEVKEGYAFSQISNLLSGLMFDFSEMKSDVPDLLKSFISQEQQLNLRPDDTLVIGYLSKETLAKLNDLLSNKMFEITPFPATEMKNYEGYHAEM